MRVVTTRASSSQARNKHEPEKRATTTDGTRIRRAREFKEKKTPREKTQTQHAPAHPYTIARRKEEP